MLANIENLVKLQAVEVERSRLVQIAKALPAEITRPSPLWPLCRRRRLPHLTR